MCRFADDEDFNIIIAINEIDNVDPRAAVHKVDPCAAVRSPEVGPPDNSSKVQTVVRPVPRRMVKRAAPMHNNLSPTDSSNNVNTVNSTPGSDYHNDTTGANSLPPIVKDSGGRIFSATKQT